MPPPSTRYPEPFVLSDIYLAVEVISPSSRVSDLYLKKQLYAEWGIGSAIGLVNAGTSVQLRNRRKIRS
jgi:hypothetical protein